MSDDRTNEPIHQFDETNGKAPGLDGDDGGAADETRGGSGSLLGNLIAEADAILDGDATRERRSGDGEGEGEDDVTSYSEEGNA